MHWRPSFVGTKRLLALLLAALTCWTLLAGPASASTDPTSARQMQGFKRAAIATGGGLEGTPVP